MTAPISIVVPTYDSASYLRGLHESIVKSSLAPLTEEIIFVSEGSGDNTDEILAELAKTSPVRTVNFRPKERLGKFRSRFEGAKLAKANRVLLMDSRVKLTSRTAEAFSKMPERYKIVIGHEEIDEKKNIFCLYWRRTHARIFHRNFERRDEVIEIRQEDFEKFGKGTTILFADRDLFVKTCEALSHTPMYSDDTYLLKEMSADTPMIVHPDVRFEWEPRSEWWKFLKHLYDRGPGFAEYHVFEHRGWLFYLVALGAAGLAAVLALLFVQPFLALGLLGAGLVGMFLSTALFAKNPIEFLRLAPLHTLSLLAYGLGALNGTRVIFMQRMKGHAHAKNPG